MKTKLILFLIIFISFILRIYNLSVTPPSPDWDEVSLGYNAYSILKTGKDEYGNFLPVTLRSFNDYKPALYVYSAIPSVAIFGLNTFSVRLPSVVFGTLTVLGTYFLSLEIYKRFKKDKAENLALMTSFFLAISPWHLQFSRGAFEVNSSLFFIVWGGVFLLNGLKKGWFLPISAIFFSISLYAYHSARVFVPLLLVASGIIFYKEILKHKKFLFVSLVIGTLLILPVVLILVSPEGRQRFSGVSIYSDQTGLLSESVRRIDFENSNKLPFPNFWNNRRFIYAQRFYEGYLWYFSPKWLFINGDGIGRHHAPNFGLLYLFEIPLILSGMYLLANEKDKAKWFVFAWFLFAAVPGAPTNQVPHAIRSFNFLPIYQIFTALGLYFWIFKLNRNIFGKLVMVIYLIFAVLNFAYYFQIYHFHLSREFSAHWQYGYEKVVEKVSKIENKYERIVFANSLEQPYIFYLFYSSYDPVKYLKNGGSNMIDYHNWSHLQIDKYEFKRLDWQKDNSNLKTLYIGKPNDFGGNARIIDSVNYLDGSVAMVLVEGK